MKTFDVNHLLDLNTFGCGWLPANTDVVYGPISGDARRCIETGMYWGRFEP